MEDETVYKKVALSLATVSALSILVTGATFALFSDSTNNDANTFTAGTVSLNQNPAASNWKINGIAPGDSGSVNWTVTYTGNIPAWLGVEASATGDLYTCDGGKVTLTVTDENGADYPVDGVRRVVGNTPVNPGDSVTFTLYGELDRSAGNDCQGKSLDFTINAYAVQAKNNPIDPVTGQPEWN